MPSTEVFKELEKLFATPEPPQLGPGPRAGVQPQSVLQSGLARILAKARGPDSGKQLLQALLLLWHDHLDSAHAIAQSIEGPDGAFVHAILHRREPDYSNAAYWFRRVGRHAVFLELASRATQLLERGHVVELRAKLLRDGKWDPFGFVDACEQAEKPSTSESNRNVLRQIQRAEFEVLLAHFFKMLQ